MPVDRERQQMIRASVAHIRERLGEASVDDNPFQECQDLAEVLALLVALCRVQEVDEGLAVEVVVKAIDSTRGNLTETAQIMQALGYAKVAPVLRRLAKRARPRPLPPAERLRIPFLRRIAARAR
jgi:hypothetical protein